MSYQQNEQFPVELTDEDLEEINGGLFSIGEVFPLGTLDPSKINRVPVKVIKPRDIFPNGMFPPIREIEHLDKMRFH
ncbi:MAG: hypothetical protein AAGB01_05035 [Cyanobacteria bacterium P01_F01_bin.42]